MPVCEIFGDLELVTAPTVQPLSIAQTKEHLTVQHAEHDALIFGLIDVATDYVEKAIEGNRQLMTATYDLPVEDWWGGERLRLPRPPLQSVTSVKYYDTGSVQQTLASTNYTVRTPWRGPGTIERAPLTSWPALQADKHLPITIRFVCGYSSSKTVPHTTKQAMLLLIGHWYLNREAVAPGQVPQELAFSVNSLLQLDQWGSYR